MRKLSSANQVLKPPALYSDRYGRRHFLVSYVVKLSPLYFLIPDGDAHLNKDATIGLNNFAVVPMKDFDPHLQRGPVHLIPLDDYELGRN